MVGGRRLKRRKAGCFEWGGNCSVTSVKEQKVRGSEGKVKEYYSTIKFFSGIGLKRKSSKVKADYGIYASRREIT